MTATTRNRASGAAAQAILAALTHAQDGVDWGHQDVGIERAGKKITLPIDPGPMPIDDAIAALERKRDEEEMLMDIFEDIDAFPLEGAVAFVQAMADLYGWASPVPTPGFFGPVPPDMLTVEVGPNEFKQVPWGAFKVPGIEYPLNLRVAVKDGHAILRVTGQVRQRERQVLLELARHTRELLKTDSIYRGKALRIQTNGDGELDISNPPKFLDLAGINPDELILSQDVADQINVNIFAPIRNTQTCRQHNIPLKRGVLLSGRYGVGKTMTTMITAKVCVDNDWTFITVDRAANLKEALLFAQRYQPAVVFCEDIDRAVSERDEQANDLLNTIDGILGKRAEVMVVLTTNHVELIEPAMLRPGRLDAVITVSPPDGEAVQRLIRLYSRGLLKAGEKLDEVGEVLAGNIPAVVREVVERAKLAMIAHGHTELAERDLLVSALGMQQHLALLEPRAVEPTAFERLGQALSDVVRSTLVAEADEDGEPIDASDLRVVRQEVRKYGQATLEAAQGVQESVGRVAQDTSKLKGMREQVEEIHEATV